MIGKAKAISHGINNLSYIMGESRSKKHPEKIDYIRSYSLPAGLDAKGVWESMQATTAGYYNLKNTLIQVELSPAKEYTEHYKFKDWEELWKDFMEEFDKQVIKDKKGKIKSKATNLAGSKGVVYLHRESKGEIPHLHGGFCRVDEEGNVNNDHDIHLRAQRAAEAVARKRGWKAAIDVRADTVKHVSLLCEDILKSMPMWSWSDYKERIEQAEGGHFKLKARTDSNNIVKGYVIIDGKAKYKASELGRNLTYSRLYATWLKFHPMTVSKPEERPARRWQSVKTVDPVQLPLNRKTKEPSEEAKPTVQKVTPKQQTRPKFDYTIRTPNRSSVDVDIYGTIKRIYLPKSVLRLFDDEFDYREVENWEPLTNLACAYFAALLSPDVPMSTGGGGSSDDKGWGRDKDEDDIEFARRCARMAKSKIGVVKKSRGFHR